MSKADQTVPTSKPAATFDPEKPPATSGRWSRDEVLELARVETGPCVSIFLPTHKTGRETAQDPTRLKNLVRDAIRQGAGEIESEKAVRAMLAPATELLADEEFWRHRDEALAILASADRQIVKSMFEPCQELAIVADRFHIKPLLPLIDRGRRFFVLAMSQNDVRLLEGTRFGIEELHPTQVPGDLADALWMDDPEKSLQFHTTGSSGGAASGAMFHGQGAGDDDENTNLERYFRAVDAGLVEFVGKERIPLVLATLEHYLPIYKQVTNYPVVMDRVVAGNPEGRSPRELHKDAWDIVEPQLTRNERETLTRIREALGTDQGITDLPEIVKAASNGRVAELVVAGDSQRWGRPVDDTLETPTVHADRKPGDVDLLDLAAAQTLVHGGAVAVRDEAEIPGDQPAAAVLRY